MTKKQIRIYYECIEQAQNYIRPIIEKSCSAYNADMVMVRRPKSSKELNAGSVAAIQTMTTPDCLITGVADDKEFPLCLIEFTEAVTTEDHELQRTNGAVAAYLAGAYYIKIAGKKYSEKEFGGAGYNPLSTPKIFLQELDYEGYIIADWKTKPDNECMLQRNSLYPSCPPDIAILTTTLQIAVSDFLFSEAGWYKRSLVKLKGKEVYQSYRNQVAGAAGAKELLETWGGRRDSNKDKQRYFVGEDFVMAKINRFSHSMDPDRGILTFISCMFSNTRQIFGIYALRRTSKALTTEIKNLSSMRKQLSTALKKDSESGGGVPEWFENELISAAHRAKTMTDRIDITAELLRHRMEISQNKVMFTIAYLLDGIYLNHNGICLTWDKRRLIGAESNNFLLEFSKYFGFSNYTAPTRIVKIENEVDEDEVTYTIVHKVLIPNGFQIVSVSYPGAQGDGAILPNPQMGKSQSREYIDVLALPPAKSQIDVVLNESKGLFSKVAVEKDLKKILQYKKDSQYRTALRETLLVARVIDENREIKNIVIGVAFGTTNAISTVWQPNNVDFIFRITNRKRWAIGIFKQQMLELIQHIEGTTDFPTVYKLDNRPSLF